MNGGPAARRAARVAAALGVVLSAASCVNAEVEARQMEEIQAAGQAIADVRQYIMDLEARVDSLAGVAAKQDTAIRLIVDFTGVIVPAYRPPD